ncbi:dNA translocase ftsK [Clostridium sp. CAG:914]|nr:dNA translocase ftsK [Clostridium sp. CAG:914]
MAKKKQKKEKEKFEYSEEILGVLIVLICVIGILGYGRAGNFFRSFAVFLTGICYAPFLIILLILGLYLIVKRKMPNLLTTKFIGSYMISLTLLVYCHREYIKLNSGSKIITETFTNVMSSFRSPQVISNTGGGMIGAIFGYTFDWAFSDGIYIVLITIALLGLILVFNTSLIDLVKKIKVPKFKKVKKDIKESNEEEEAKDEEVEDKRIIISSMEELSHIKDNDINVDKDIPIKDAMDEEKSAFKKDEEVTSNPNYKLPPISLLKSAKNVNNKENENNAKECISKLEEVFKVFEISGKIVQVNIGPTVTQYEMELKAGTKVNKLLSIQREIALALAAKDVRIQAPIPGKSTIGIELPNKVNAAVSFKEVFSSMPSVNEKNLLAVGLGKDIMGKVRWVEINDTPHMLVAGSTGSGKSVCINCIIASILMRSRPEEVKLVLVDPKKVEFSMYNGVPHLLCPVVTNPKKASVALQNIVSEMERRYELFEHTKCKKISQYNEFCERNPEYKKLPYIVVIIDELADLMLVAAKEVEDSIMRITQMARAAGIHLIVATQRPSTDIITGVVKANIPTRISFAVSSSIDSRTILDMVGAEKLLGKGDMLFLPMGENQPTRIQGAFVSEEELQKIVDFTISQQKACYDESITMDNSSSSGEDNYNDGYVSEEEYDDPLYNEIVDFAIRSGKISASLIQRKYRLGYNRAARIVDLLEERGIIGPQNGSKPREVLVKLEDNNNSE